MVAFTGAPSLGERWGIRRATGQAGSVDAMTLHEDEAAPTESGPATFRHTPCSANGPGLPVHHGEDGGRGASGRRR